MQIFSYALILTCDFGAQKNRHNETVLLCIHNICFVLEIRFFSNYIILSRGLLVCAFLGLHATK